MVTRQRAGLLRAPRHVHAHRDGAKPNPQAAALVLLVRRYPDTLARLDEVAEG